MWTDTFEYKKHPAQMLKVAGDFRRVLGAFENPVYHFIWTASPLNTQLNKMWDDNLVHVH